jgi:phage antirepressor YoqD-like protein
MTNLTRIENKGIELIIDRITGEVFASQGMVARICECESTQIRRFKGDDFALKSLEIEDSRGVTQKIKLYPEQLIKECLLKFNPEKLLACVDAGLRVYLHKLAGFSVTSTATAQSFEIPKTFSEALLLAGKLQQEKEALEAQALINKPKVEFADAIAFSDDAIEFHEFAKMIGTGRNRLMKRLRQIGILMQNSTIPYQKYIDAGYFDVSQEITTSGKLVPFALVTGKGQLWLHQKLNVAPLPTQGVLNFNID